MAAAAVVVVVVVAAVALAAGVTPRHVPYYYVRSLLAFNELTFSGKKAEVLERRFSFAPETGETATHVISMFGVLGHLGCLW